MSAVNNKQKKCLKIMFTVNKYQVSSKTSKTLKLGKDGNFIIEKPQVIISSELFPASISDQLNLMQCSKVNFVITIERLTIITKTLSEIKTVLS